MWRHIDGICVNQLQRRVQGIVEHQANVRRVLLSILIHGDHPIAGSAGHARQGGGVLTVIARQPDRLGERILSADGFNGGVRPVWSAVMNQQDLADNETLAAKCGLLMRQRRDFFYQGGQSAGPLVDRNDDGDTMHGMVIYGLGRGIFGWEGRY